MAIKSRTIQYAAAVAVLGAVQAALPEIREFIPEQVYGYLLVAIAAGIAYFRAITTQPLSEK